MKWIRRLIEALKRRLAERKTYTVAREHKEIKKDELKKGGWSY